MPGTGYNDNKANMILTLKKLAVQQGKLWDKQIYKTQFMQGTMKREVTQSCLTLCDPMDCSLLGSSVHGIFQARILEWVAIFFSRGSSDPGIKPRSPVLQADALLSELPGKTGTMKGHDKASNLVWSQEWMVVPFTKTGKCKKI